MNTDAAHRLARKLMDEHGLESWTFAFDRALHRAGVCYERRKHIGASRLVTEHVTEDEFRDTMLHEIAHALVGNKHSHDGHWRRMYGSIGGNGGATFTATPELKAATAAVAKYVATCDDCGHTYRVHRRLKGFDKRGCGQSSCVYKFKFAEDSDRTYLVWYEAATNKRVH